MRALLDVNVLLALLDRDHVDHERARAWITGQIERGWASCAITQNGFVRVISQPRYPSPISVAHAIDLLARATHTRYHEFWSCTVSILDSKVIDRSCTAPNRSPTRTCWPSRSLMMADLSPSISRLR
ncbi:toxin VapC44 [Mycobacterium tuberculosis BTB10-295]|nr:toxin VapC44 [Mycobacterium tuberculosis BTB10-295]